MNVVSTCSTNRIKGRITGIEKWGWRGGRKREQVLSQNEVISIIDWLLKIFNICMESGVVTDDRNAACIVPVCKE